MHSCRPVDWTRTARMAFMGGTLHGPFFFKGMRLLDQRFGTERTLRTAALKSAVGQMTLFPSYTAIFFLYAGILEGATLQASADKLVAAFPTACASGTLYWPVVNLITFQLPPSSRLAFLGTAGVAWNGLLSFLAARPNKP